MSDPAVCVVCREQGKRTAATHRLVARGRVKELTAEGRQPISVHADLTECTVCQEHVAALMEPGRMGRVRRARFDIRILAALQESAREQGYTYTGHGFDWGFADIDKPLWLVAAEMQNPANFVHGAGA